MSTTRFYLGDASDLDGMSRDEVEDRTTDNYRDCEEAYEDELNECYAPVSVCGFDYDAGTALRRLDETAFRCGVSDSTVEVDLDDYPVGAE